MRCLIIALLIIALLLIAPLASAQVYKSVDAQGRTHYCDRPCTHTSNLPLELPPLNRQQVQPEQIPRNPHHLLPEQESPQPVYTVLTVQGIAVDQAVRANDGNFTAHINVQPPLKRQHQLQWLLDNQPYGPPGTRTDLQLVNVDRGEHQLAARVLEGDTVVQQSPAVRFNLQRHFVHKGQP